MVKGSGFTPQERSTALAADVLENGAATSFFFHFAKKPSYLRRINPQSNFPGSPTGQTLALLTSFLSFHPPPPPLPIPLSACLHPAAVVFRAPAREPSLDVPASPRRSPRPASSPRRRSTAPICAASAPTRLGFRELILADDLFLTNVQRALKGVLAYRCSLGWISLPGPP